MTTVLSDYANTAVKEQGKWILEAIRMNGQKPPSGDESNAMDDGPSNSRCDSESAAGCAQAASSNAATEHFPASREELVLPLKVAAIRAAIASGTYNVPASAVAAKIVDAMLGVRK